MESGGATLILDTSVLVNFLAIDRAHLLARLKSPVLVTDHVVAEVTEHYVDQLHRLEAALAAKHLVQTQLTAIAELEDFAKLSSRKSSRNKTLGDGECSAIAIALHRRFALGIDDKAAIKFVRAEYPVVQIRQTVELMVELIEGGAVSVEDADGIKVDWAQNHHFALTNFVSFRELTT